MVKQQTARSPADRLAMKMLIRLLTDLYRLHVSTTIVTALPHNDATISGTSVPIRCMTSEVQT